MNDLATNVTDHANGLASVQGLDLDQLETLHTQVHAWTNDAGTRVQFVEARGLAIVDVTLRFAAGTVQDDDKPGLAALTLYMLDEGSAGLTAAQHAEHLERLGVVVGKQVRLGHATLSLRSLSHEALLNPALELFTSLAAQPDFHPHALAKVKQQLLSFNASRNKVASLRAQTAAFRHLFDGHPYSNPLGSTPEGIDAVTVEDLAAFHRKAYSASNMQMTLVGDLSIDQAKAISERISLALPQGWTAAQLPPVPIVQGTTLHVEQPGASNAALLAVPINVPANDPQHMALLLAREVLASGLDSRLMQELRQRRGLTYGVHSTVSSTPFGGVFTIGWDIASHYVKGSQDLVKELLRAFIEHGPTEQELQLARQQMAGRLLRSIAQNEKLSVSLADNGYQLQPQDAINTYTHLLSSFTAQAIREVLQRRLDMGSATCVSVGPTVDQQPLPATPAIDQEHR
jgi:zinc protease